MKIQKLFNILISDKPSLLIKKNEDDIFKLIPELKKCKDFKQNNEWHIYDVYEHILHVVDNVPNDIKLRLAALFHDIGKPASYTEDENGIGHFHGHWVESQKIFEQFSKKYHLDKNASILISDLVYYHDANISKLNDAELEKLLNIFDYDGIYMLYQLKRADLLAQNEKYHYILNDYDNQETKIFKKCKKIK